MPVSGRDPILPQAFHNLVRDDVHQVAPNILLILKCLSGKIKNFPRNVENLDPILNKPRPNKMNGKRPELFARRPLKFILVGFDHSPNRFSDNKRGSDKPVGRLRKVVAKVEVAGIVRFEDGTRINKYNVSAKGRDLILPIFLDLRHGRIARAPPIF